MYAACYAPPKKRHLSNFKSRNGRRGFWTIARVMYETTVIPPEWAEPLKSFDEVWAPYVSFCTRVCEPNCTCVSACVCLHVCAPARVCLHVYV